MFAPITLYKDPNYGAVRLTQLEKLEDCYFAVFTVSNRSDGVLVCDIGRSKYVDDVLYPQTGRSREYITNVESGEEKTVKQVIPVKQHSGASVDVALKLTYDNGETGVYNQKIVLVDDVFNLCKSETAVSGRYTPTGRELFTAKTEEYVLLATGCGKEGQLYREVYWVDLYVENTSDGFIEVVFDEMVTVSSDRQASPYYLASAGRFFLDHGLDRYVLAPGKCCYLKASVNKEEVDRYAKDINEAVKVSIPVWVGDAAGTHAGTEETGCTWREDHVIVIARELLAAGK